MSCKIEGTGLVWPDNRPAYDIATQMEFYTDPNVQFTAMDELAKAVEENDVQQVGNDMHVIAEREQIVKAILETCMCCVVLFSPCPA